MDISIAEMQTLILDTLNGTSEENTMPCTKLALTIAFNKKLISDTNISYAFLSHIFRDTFLNALENLLSIKKVQTVPSSGPNPWSGYVFLV